MKLRGDQNSNIYSQSERNPRVFQSTTEKNRKGCLTDVEALDVANHKEAKALVLVEQWFKRISMWTAKKERENSWGLGHRG